jgi:isocitrate dehydrogenase
MTKTRITVAHGDGIGPEIMEATIKILDAAGADLEYDTIEIGEKVYLAGEASGISNNSWDTLLKNKVFLKAPITTPQGSGFKSLNVTVRKSLGLFANIRPCQSLAPFVPTKHPKLDLIIVRENEEDLYAGIEHRQTDEVYQCLKLISRPGCERLIRYAFEYAKKMSRKKVSCFTKDNIMKMTDGLFHKVFDEIAEEYPEIESEHWIIDIGAAKMADRPEDFDVIVLPNLYGDILSDVAAQIAGSVGLAGSSNIGEHGAMFEAIHGSAPRRAGQNMANPSGLIFGAIQMLQYLGKGECAAKIQNALYKTIEDGIVTYDIFRDEAKQKKVGTKEFAEAIIERLDQEPKTLPKADYRLDTSINIAPYQPRPSIENKKLVGVDVFIHAANRDANVLAKNLLDTTQALSVDLAMITNRGVKVWPDGLKETFCTDHWRCRFMAPANGITNHAVIWMLLRELNLKGLEVIKTENLYYFGDERGFSLGQGQ